MSRSRSGCATSGLVPAHSVAASFMYSFCTASSAGGGPGGATGGLPGAGGPPSGGAGQRPSGASSGPASATGRALPSGAAAGGGAPGGVPGNGSATGAHHAFGGAPTGVGGGAAVGTGGATTSAALASALRAHASSYRWVAATFGSQSAASLELATGEPVMAIGGFNGQGGDISLATFQAYVAKGEIHYLIASGGLGGGPGGGTSNSDAAITRWVEVHFARTTIGGQTVYELTNPE